MTDKQKIKASVKRASKNIQEGLVRIDLQLDYKTYLFLLAVVEKSGYKIDKRSKQKSQGIRGVLTQGILELYQKYNIETSDYSDKKLHRGLSKINQQAFIFSNQARAMKKNEVPKENIISTLNDKLPEYAKNHKVGKLLKEESMDEFLNASSFSKIKRPQITEAIQDNLEQLKLIKYFNAPTKEG